MNTRTLVALASASAIMAACASAPEPADNQIVRAETSIENAVDGGAQEYASELIEDARDKLGSAKLAAEKGEDEAALRLAEQAELDARVALARAEQSEAEGSLREIRQGIDTLRNELERSQLPPGGTQ